MFSLLASPRFTGDLGRLRPFAGPVIGMLGVLWRAMAGLDYDTGTTIGPAWGAQAGGAVSVGTAFPIEIGLEGRLLRPGSHDFSRPLSLVDPTITASVIRSSVTVATARLFVIVAM